MAASPVAATPAAPAPPPNIPDPPSDSVNFDTLDSPPAAANLPILEPAVQAAIVLAALSAAMSSHPSIAYVDANILTGTNALPAPAGTTPNQATVTYIIDPTNQNTPLREGGIVGSRFDSNALSMDPKAGTAQFTGPNSPVNLTFSSSQSSTPCVNMDGSLGAVDAHIAFSALPQTTLDGAQQIGFHAEGTLGGQAYVSDTIINSDGSPNATMTVRGKLGDKVISKDYTMSADTDPNGGAQTLHAIGKGVNAGVPEQVDVRLRMAGH
jgi:hypothetical protein